MHAHITHTQCFLAISVSNYCSVLRKDNCSDLDQNVLMAVAEAVEAMQQECGELECKRW